VGVPFEATSIKPVALAPVGASVIHIYPLSSHKKREYHSHAGGAIPPEKSKKAGSPPPSCVALLFGL
jgi:hypothetical protein